MKNLLIDGHQEYVIEKLLEVMDINSSLLFLSRMNEMKCYLEHDEVLSKDTRFPSLSTFPDIIHFPRTIYRIDIKPTTLIILSLIYDLNISQGMMTDFFGVKAYHYQNLLKLKKHNGELCMVIEALKDVNYTLSEAKLLKHKVCHHPELKCMYNENGVCNMTFNEAVDVICRLWSQNAFKMSDHDYKLNL